MRFAPQPHLIFDTSGCPARRIGWRPSTGRDEADSPGIWMDHCHNLWHAGNGMMVHLACQGVASPCQVGRGLLITLSEDVARVRPLWTAKTLP